MRTRLRIVCYVLDTRTQRWTMSSTRVHPLPLASRACTRRATCMGALRRAWPTGEHGTRTMPSCARRFATLRCSPPSMLIPSGRSLRLSPPRSCWRCRARPQLPSWACKRRRVEHPPSLAPDGHPRRPPPPSPPRAQRRPKFRQHRPKFRQRRPEPPAVSHAL